MEATVLSSLLSPFWASAVKLAHSVVFCPWLLAVGHNAFCASLPVCTIEIKAKKPHPKKKIGKSICPTEKKEDAESFGGWSSDILGTYSQRMKGSGLV